MTELITGATVEGEWEYGTGGAVVDGETGKLAANRDYDSEKLVLSDGKELTYAEGGSILLRYTEEGSVKHKVVTYSDVNVIKQEMNVWYDNTFVDSTGKKIQSAMIVVQTVSLLPSDGLLVTNADDKNCINLNKYTKANFITYGIDNQDANFVAKNISFDKNGFASFDVYKNNELYDSFKLSIAGKHNVSNALACIALCDYYGISKDVIRKSLLQFTGAERRLEYKGSIKNNTISIFDDYAHHPTEIKATFNALKNKKFNESWVIFQPHTFSRTKKLLNDFAESLKDFDHIILVDIYAARENDDYDVSSNDLVNLINAKNKKATYLSSFDDVAEYIESHTQKDDLVLTLGAGSVTKIGPMIINLDKRSK